MRLSCRRVLAGDPADEPGRLGGVVSAVGAQRAAPGQRQPGREGDPQLRAGGQGRPGRAGPVGVIDLAVPHPGAGRRRGDGRRTGRGPRLPAAGRGVDIGSAVGTARDRRRTATGGRRAPLRQRGGRACAVRAGGPARPRTGLEARGDPVGGRAGGDRAARRADRRSGLPGDGLSARRLARDRCGSVRSVAHLLNLDLDIVFVDTTSTYWEVETADTDPSWPTPPRTTSSPAPPRWGRGRSGTPRTPGPICLRW